MDTTENMSGEIYPVSIEGKTTDDASHDERKEMMKALAQQPAAKQKEVDKKVELSLCQKAVRAYTLVLACILLVPGMVVTTGCLLVGVLGAIGLITVVVVTFMCLFAVKLLLSFCCLPCNPDFNKQYLEYREKSPNFCL